MANKDVTTARVKNVMNQMPKSIMEKRESKVRNTAVLHEKHPGPAEAWQYEQTAAGETSQKNYCNRDYGSRGCRCCHHVENHPSLRPCSAA